MCEVSWIFDSTVCAVKPWVIPLEHRGESHFICCSWIGEIWPGPHLELAGVSPGRLRSLAFFTGSPVLSGVSVWLVKQPRNQDSTVSAGW